MSLRTEIIAVLKGLPEPATIAEIVTLFGDGTTAAEVNSEVARMLRHDPPLLRRVHNPRGFLKYTLRSRLDVDAEDSTPPDDETASLTSESEKTTTAPAAQEPPATAKESPRANASSWHATTTKYGGKSKRVYDVVARAGRPISAKDVALALGDGATAVQASSLLHVLKKQGKVVTVGASHNARWIVATDGVNAVAASSEPGAAPTPPEPSVPESVALHAIGIARRLGEEKSSPEPESQTSDALTALRLNLQTAEDAIESYVHSRVDEDVYRSLCMARYHARAALEKHTAGGTP